MAIQALPPTTVRAIGASLVIADPCALVKELLDNALDAKATSVFIEISPDTLDVIQVRDNGIGIPPEDRPLVAKRYCTSKIRDEKDLSTLGGSYLGFRGEALSSAAQMSGAMTTTTRVDGEATAACLKIDQQGAVFAQERASQATGTTVRITDFLKDQPVRKQVVLKTTARCIARIKDTLQAYAFARRHVRLSLRVLKSDKDSWVFAPKPASTLQDTALKIVGQACTSQCMVVDHTTDAFDFHALLPRSDAEPSQILGMGQFVAIDNRPMNPARGIAKQLVKLVKSSVERADSRLAGIRSPFLFLGIECKEASYDLNIEPTKDDAVFEDRETLLSCAQGLLNKAYSVQIVRGEIANDSAPSRPDEPLQTAVSEPQTLQQPSPRSPKRHDRIANMCDSAENDHIEALPGGEDVPDSELDLEELPERPSIFAFNPWVMAKINACGRKSGASASRIVDVVRDALGGCEPTSPLRLQDLASHHAALPTPDPSSPVRQSMEDASSSSPVHGHPREPSSSSPVRGDRASNLLRSSPPASNSRAIGLKDLRLPRLYQAPATGIAPGGRPALLSATHGLSSDELQQPLESTPSSSDPMHASGASQGSSLDLPPNESPQRQRPSAHRQTRSRNKAFVPPIPPERDAWFHIPGAQKTAARGPKYKSTQRQPAFRPPIRQPDTDVMTEITRPLSPPRLNTDIRGFLDSNGPPTTLRDMRSNLEVSSPAHQLLAAAESQRSQQGTETETVPDEAGPQSDIENVPRTLMARVNASGRPALTQVTPQRINMLAGKGISELIPRGSDKRLSQRPQEPQPRAVAMSSPRECSTVAQSPKGSKEEVTVKTSLSDLDRLARVSKTNEDGTFLEWGFAEREQDRLPILQEGLTNDTISIWAVRIRELLRRMFPDGEMVQDLEGPLSQVLHSSLDQRDTTERGEIPQDQEGDYDYDLEGDMEEMLLDTMSDI